MAISSSDNIPETRIFINDVTLRDGEQAPGNSMNTEQKLMVAQQLVRLGINGIESGFPAASPGDFEAVQAIANEVGSKTLRGHDGTQVHPRISGLARLEEKDIGKTLDAIKPAPLRGIHTFISTSEDQMEKFAGKVERRGGKRNNIKDFLEKVVFPDIERNFGIIKSTDPDAIIQFSPEDWTRTAEPVSDDVITAAVQNGAKIINLPDTVGVGIPRIVGRRVRHVRELLDRLGFGDVVISWHGHNDTGQGVANAMEALYGGAEQFEPTILGVGERTGNFSFEGFLAALDANKSQHEEIMGKRISDTIVREETMASARLLASILNIDVSREHPLVGENAFAHESGIHQHGMLAGRLNGKRLYEALNPERYGAVSKLILGKHSGWAALKDFITRHGLPQRDTDREYFSQALASAGDTRRKGLSDSEVLEHVYYPVIIERTGGPYVLRVDQQELTNDCITVSLDTKKGAVSGVASAPDEGKIDAIVHAMKKIIPNINIPKDGFSLRTVGEGSEAAALVKMTLENDHTVTCHAQHHNTGVAEHDALLKAFNALKAIEDYKAAIVKDAQAPVANG